MGPFYFICS